MAQKCACVHWPDKQAAAMKNKSMPIRAGLTVGLAVLAAGAAISAQDKYTLKVPNGLAFSKFRGYDTWQTISISKNADLMAVILGKPAMIDAFKSGVPGNGKPFPDGAKMAKIHWKPKINAGPPDNRWWPPPSMTSISWSRMARGSRTAAAGDMRNLNTTRRPIHSERARPAPSRRR
jgi:Cytochrome P460